MFTTGQIIVFVLLGVVVIVVIVLLFLHLISEWRKVKFIKPRNGPTRPPYAEVPEVMTREQFVKLQNELKQNESGSPFETGSPSGDLPGKTVANGTAYAASKRNTPTPKRNTTFQRKNPPTKIKKPVAAVPENTRSTIVTARDIHTITEA